MPRMQRRQEAELLPAVALSRGLRLTPFGLSLALAPPIARARLCSFAPSARQQTSASTHPLCSTADSFRPLWNSVYITQLKTIDRLQINHIFSGSTPSSTPEGPTHPPRASIPLSSQYVPDNCCDSCAVIRRQYSPLAPPQPRASSLFFRVSSTNASDTKHPIALPWGRGAGTPLALSWGSANAIFGDSSVRAKAVV
jgi:hypothetical protein